MAGNQNEGSIYYEVELETAKLISGSRKASEVLGNLDKNARGASSGIDKLGSSGDKASGSMGTLKSALSGLASAISVAIIIDYGKAFLTVADNVTQLQSRIARLSDDASQAGVTFAALAQIASISGASLQDTQKLWEKLTSSLKGSGASNSQILFLTDTLQKIGRVGGSSAEEMAAALRQFGQSIDGGVVRAEEFNSVVESMPELARQMAAGMGLSMGQLRQAMLEGKVTAEAALNAIAKQSGVVNSEFRKLPRTMDQASNALTVSFSLLIGKMNEATGASKTMVTIIDSISSAIDRLSGRAVTAAQSISDLTSTAEMYSRRAKTWSWLGLDGWSEQNQSLAALSTKAATLAGDMDSVAKSSVNAANSADGFVKVSTANPKQDNLIKNSQRRIEMSKLEGEARARLQAQYDAEDAGINKSDPRVKQLEDQYAETYRNTQALKENNSESKKSASQSSAIAQKLADLKQQSELAAESTQELTREKAVLNAQQSLGKGATENDIRLAGEYAAKTFDSAKAVRDLAQAQQGRKFATQEIAAAKVMPDAQTGTAEDPLAQIKLQESQKLAALAQYQSIDIQNAQIYEDAKTAIQQQAANAREQIAINERQTYQQNMSALLGATSNSVGAVADAIGQAAGKSSGAYQAMFAVSKGFAVAQAALNMQTAIGNAMALPYPANLPAIAQAVAAGGQMVSAISGISYGGARKNGGPVSAGSMYQVGEGGKPEIYQASTGKQYMIPGDNGKVISNKDMQGSGGGGTSVQQNVHFNIQTTNGIDDATMQKMVAMMKTVSLNQMKDQSTRPGGMLQPRK